MFEERKSVNKVLDAKHVSSYNAEHEQARHRLPRQNPFHAVRGRFDALCLTSRGREHQHGLQALDDAGRFCAGYHDAKVKGVKAKRVQVDEIWSFTAAKQKNVAAHEAARYGAGDTWTWTAIEADTKFIVSHFVGGRDGDCAAWFMQDVADRVANRIQLTSDGHKAYLDAVEGAFGADIDYAMLVKIYGASSESREGPLQPCRVHRRAEAPGRRQSRPEARQHVLQRAREPHDADAQPPLHSAHECLLEEIREPRAYGRDLCRLVRLDSHPQDARVTPAMAAGLSKTLMTGRTF